MSEPSPYEELMTEVTDRPTSSSAKDEVESQLQELLQTLLDLSIVVYDFQPDGNKLVWNKM